MFYSLSPTGELLVIAHGSKFVLLTSRWNNDQTNYTYTLKGELENPNDIITSLICLPIVGTTNTQVRLCTNRIEIEFEIIQESVFRIRPNGHVLLLDCRLVIQYFTRTLVLNYSPNNGTMNRFMQSKHKVERKSTKNCIYSTSAVCASFKEVICLRCYGI